MCLGVPGLVVALQEPVGGLAHALVEFAGVRRPVCVACVPDVEPGEHVIVHAGIAISRVDPAEAARIFAELEASGDREWADTVSLEGDAGRGEMTG